MQHANEEDTPNYNKEQLLWKIRTALAGRAAEKEFFGEEKGTNTGISSDLRQATNMAMSMICRYGMDGDLLVSMSPEAVLNSPRGNQLIEQANEILKREMKVTEELVAKGRDKIQALSEFLLQKNQATEDDISRVFGLQNKEPSE
jgi:ATP-dependent Zn protease